MAKQRVVAGGTLDAATTEEIAKLLQSFGKSGHIAFGSAKIEKTLENWPVVGHERKVRVANLHGTNNFVVAAGVYTDIIPANAGRGGLSLINISANPCFVFLTTATESQANNGAVAAGYLAANGGAWDGKISGEMWAGDVSAFSAAGCTLVIAEI